MNVLDLAQKKVILKKVATTNGGEWHGPCPACGGTDRFHVWPEQNEHQGAYWCRACNLSGDAIQFLRDFDGMSFRDACSHLNIDVPDRPDTQGATSDHRPPERPAFEPVIHAAPADLWQEKAEKFVGWAQDSLAKNTEVLNWLNDRGISNETAANYRLGWNPGDDGKDIYRARKGWGLPEIKKEDGKSKVLWIPRGLVIPHIINGVVHRVRIRRPDGDPRYYVLPGSSMTTMVLERDRRAFVIVEAELDGIAIASQNTLAGAVALGSVAAKPDVDACAVLRGALQILNALDYGDIGGGAKAAERAIGWWKETFPNCDRWPVPKGKDPGEAHRLGIDLNSWILAGLPPALTIAEGPVRRYETSEKRTGPDVKRQHPEHAVAPPAMDHLPAGVRELYELLRKNPAVKIVNTPERYTVLRDDRFVGGRINELVFRVPEVNEYLLKHPEHEIDAGNLIIEEDEKG